MAVKGWILGGGAAVVAVGAGAAAWAAVSFFSAGPQPAEVLPADTIAYVSLDLDPSGGQKIAALKLANKFPALKKEIGLKTTDDVRRKVIDTLTDGAGCDLDYAKDVEPWLGSTIALALVGTTDPHPAVALEVKDVDKASRGVHNVLACTKSEEEPVAFVADGHWLVFSSDEAQAHNIVTAAKKHALADDADFKKWTSAAGDSGILTAYAAPKAGSVLVDEFKKLTSDLSDSAGLGGAGLEGLGAVGPAWCPGATDPTAGSGAAFKNFKGAGATLRFSGHGLEFEMASDFGTGAKAGQSADVTNLPANIGAVLGIGFGKSWLDQALQAFGRGCGDQFDPQSLYDLISNATGLDAPADLETLTSGSAQLVVGSKIDVEKLINSEDPSDLPAALRITGDPAKIKAVIAKLAAQLPGTDVLEPQAGPGSVSIGFNHDLRDQIAQGGKLGEDPVFKAVVPHAKEAGSVLYINLAALKAAIVQAAGGDQKVEDNLSPLKAVGASGWLTGGVTHSQLELSVR